MEPIVESGMIFGPYSAGHCFHVEKSNLLKDLGAGVKTAEILVLRADREMPQVLVIEAKSSSPRAENGPRFSEYIAEIQEKLVNGFNLGVASILKRHSLAQSELPNPFQEIDLAACQFFLVLIINGHKKEWLPPLKEALGRALDSTVKTWALGPSAVLVLNEEGARKKNLIK